MKTSVKYWLAVNNIPNLGPITIKKLYEHFGSIENVWLAAEKEMYLIAGIHVPAIRAFVENRQKIDLESEFDKVNKAAINVLTLEDEEYPFYLKNIYDPPPVLYYRGRLLNNDEKAIAIVGTRKSSRYGLATAKKMAGELAAQGVIIVSGLAAGIDTAAHEGALEAGGKTLAVFGTGLDIVFPAGNANLAEKISAHGAILSEFPVGYPPDRTTFPRRNRIISGLSLGVIVVEGHYDSGAMITAKLALDQGREVFAVPGNVDLDQSKGPHWLIKQGAKLVENVDDVLEELNITKNKKTESRTRNTEHRDYTGLSAAEQKIVALLNTEAAQIDLISAKTGLPMPQLLSLLAMLEMKNVVTQLPGKMFVLA